MLKKKYKSKKDPIDWNSVTREDLRKDFEAHPNGDLVRTSDRKKDWGIDTSKGLYMTWWRNAMYPVHKILYILLRGPIPEGQKLIHSDGNKKNNAIENIVAVPIRKVYEPKLGPDRKGRRLPTLQISAEEAFADFIYKDGLLVRKSTGRVSGTLCEDGYLRVRWKDALYQVHRIVYAMHFGEVPETVDHVDGNRANNKIENLRSATIKENNWNSRPRRGCRSRFKGVDLHSASGLWRSRISGRVVGYFKTEEEAAEAYNTEAIKRHGEFAVLNLTAGGESSIKRVKEAEYGNED